MQRMHYWFGAHNFGAGNEDFYVIGPKGRKGTLVDYGIMHVNVTFTAVTTPATVSVGTAADPDAYGEELAIGALTADSGGLSVRTSSRDPDTIDNFILPAGLSLPADTRLRLACVAPTGGTPAGTAVPFMVIDWED